MLENRKRILGLQPKRMLQLKQLKEGNCESDKS